MLRSPFFRTKRRRPCEYLSKNQKHLKKCKNYMKQFQKYLDYSSAFCIEVFVEVLIEFFSDFLYYLS